MEWPILSGIAVLALAILTYFLVQTLRSLQGTLHRLDAVLIETEAKLKKLNPLSNSLENLSEIAEKETEKLKAAYVLQQFHESKEDNEALGNWLLSTLRLVMQFFTRR